jgi:hypothetical protein
MERKLTRSPACLSVCPPSITFEPIGGFGLHFYGDDAIERGGDALISNPIALSILKWLTFKVLRWMQ